MSKPKKRKNQLQHPHQLAAASATSTIADEKSSDDGMEGEAGTVEGKKPKQNKKDKNSNKKGKRSKVPAAGTADNAVVIDSGAEETTSDEDTDTDEEDNLDQNSEVARASSSNNAKNQRHAGHKRKSRSTNKRKTKRGKRVKPKKTKKMETLRTLEKVESEPVVAERLLPSHTWRGRCAPRSTCTTEWSTLNKAFDQKLREFACKEFNAYPLSLAAQAEDPPTLCTKKQAVAPKVGF